MGDCLYWLGGWQGDGVDVMEWDFLEDNGEEGEIEEIASASGESRTDLTKL